MMTIRSTGWVWLAGGVLAIAIIAIGTHVVDRGGTATPTERSLLMRSVLAGIVDTLELDHSILRVYLVGESSYWQIGIDERDSDAVVVLASVGRGDSLKKSRGSDVLTVKTADHGWIYWRITRWYGREEKARPRLMPDES